MAGKYEALCDEVPAASDGIPLQVAGVTVEWRFVVQLALPVSGTGQWGIGLWGVETWASPLQWVDVSGRFRGCDLSRGVESIGDRYRVGAATFDLDNSDFGLSDWNEDSGVLGPMKGPLNGTPEYLVPGTLIRVGLQSAGVWYPLFTGITESWVEHMSLMDADRHVVITAVDTVAFLASVDAPESSPAGSGEDQVERINRLLDAAGWEFGREFDAVGVAQPAVPLQSTTMAGNRLAECYLTADSSRCAFFSGRNGAALLLTDEGTARANDPAFVLGERARDFGGLSADELAAVRVTGTEPVAEIPYQPSPTFALDIAPVRNVISRARAGGSVVTVADSASRARYGDQVDTRLDLICQSDSDVTTAAFFALIFRKWPTRMVTATVDLNTLAAANTLILFATHDLRDALRVWRPIRQIVVGSSTETYRVMHFTEIFAMNHRIAVAGPGLLDWQCTYTLGMRGGATQPGLSHTWVHG